MLRFPFGLVPWFALLLLAAAACAGGASNKDVLIGLTDGVVIPTYQRVAQDAAGLHQAAQSLCAAPSEENLEAARDAWRSARAFWLRSRAMGFGPVMDRRSASLLDWSPTNTAGIDEFLADKGSSIDAGRVRNTMSADRRGFGAMEHLLFADNALQHVAGSPVHCLYLLALTQVAMEETAAIAATWADGGELAAPYGDYFTDRAQLSLIPEDAVSEVVRLQVFTIRDIVHMRLASALGLRGDGPDPTAIPGNAADNGLKDLRNELLGMQLVYEGAGQDSPGISALVTPLSKETDWRMREQLDAAIAAVDGVEGPMKVALHERPQQVNALYEELSTLQTTLATEVVSLLGVSVGFSDTDGDALR